MLGFPPWAMSAKARNRAESGLLPASPVLTRIAALRVMPVVVLDDASRASPLADALVSGGIPCAEITFRTPAGERALRALATRTDILVGAGTVLTVEQVDRAVDSGARFIVSPGLDRDVVERAKELAVPMLPGIATPTELQAAVGLGLDAVKLFPAEQLGGLGMIDALAAPFPRVRFMPSGGITLRNAADYLAHPSVFAIGGSWMAPRDLIADDRFDEIEKLVARTAGLLMTAETA